MGEVVRREPLAAALDGDGSHVVTVALEVGDAGRQSQATESVERLDRRKLVAGAEVLEDTFGL